MTFRDAAEVTEFLRSLQRDPEHGAWNRDVLLSTFAREIRGDNIAHYSGIRVLDLLGRAIARKQLAIVKLPPRIGGGVRLDEAPGGPTPADPTPKKERIPIDALEVVSVAWRSDHGLLKNNEKDWRHTGSVYAKPEWTRGGQNHPISHTMDSPAQLEVTIVVGPPDGEPQAGKLIGEGPDGLRFEKKMHVAPGRASHVLESKGKLRRAIARLDHAIDWRLELSVDGTVSGGSSGNHCIYLTHDTPRSAGPREAGITQRRMHKAVELIEPMGTLDPHTIVHRLMRMLPYYTLFASDKVPAEYEHPAYFNDVGGAWPMGDYISEYGECQAIVRFVMAVTAQVGLPGEGKLIVVWSDPDVDGGATALEGTGGGLNGKRKVVNGKTWYAALVDSEITEADVGKVFPPSHSRMPDGRISPGLNNFEACMKFTHDGVTKYYGGGAGVFDSKEQVLRAFHSLAWFSGAQLPNGDWGYRLEQIVKKYR